MPPEYKTDSTKQLQVVQDLRLVHYLDLEMLQAHSVVVLELLVQ